MRGFLYTFGGVGVVVVVLLMVCGGVFSRCYGYGWQESENKGGGSVGFASKDVARGYRVKGDALVMKYGLVLESVLVREWKVDFCWDVGMDINLESVRNDEILWGCDFICYAPVEGMVVDVGGIIFRNFRSSSGVSNKFWSTEVWSYGLYVGVVMEDVIFQPSLYCVYRSYTEETALEGRIEHQWDLLPLGLRDFMLGFSGEVGWDYAGKPYGLPYASSLGRKSYWYYGAALCLIYKLPIGEASVGVSYEGNAAEKYSWVNRGKDYKNNVWFNALVNFSF